LNIRDPDQSEKTLKYHKKPGLLLDAWKISGRWIFMKTAVKTLLQLKKRLKPDYW